MAMIENMIRGQPAFKPELGVGGASWFVTEGTPYTGVGAANVVPVQVELLDTEGGKVYQQAELDTIFEQEAPAPGPKWRRRCATSSAFARAVTRRRS